MSISKKAKNAAESIKGTVKEEMGRATGDRSLEAEGRVLRAKGRVKQAGENLRDASKGR